MIEDTAESEEERLGRESSGGGVTDADTSRGCGDAGRSWIANSTFRSNSSAVMLESAVLVDDVPSSSAERKGRVLSRSALRPNHRLAAIDVKMVAIRSGHGHDLDQAWMF